MWILKPYFRLTKMWGDSRHYTHDHQVKNEFASQIYQVTSVSKVDLSHGRQWLLLAATMVIFRIIVYAMHWYILCVKSNSAVLTGNRNSSPVLPKFFVACNRNVTHPNYLLLSIYFLIFIMKFIRRFKSAYFLIKYQVLPKVQISPHLSVPPGQTCRQNPYCYICLHFHGLEVETQYILKYQKQYFKPLSN